MDTVLLGDGVVRGPIGVFTANRPDLVIREPRPVAPFPEHPSAMPPLDHLVGHIRSGVSQEQVIWTDTGWVVAPVQDPDTAALTRRSPVGQEPRHPGGAALLSPCPEVPIPQSSSSRRPDPARSQFRTVLGDRAILIYFGPESLLYREATTFPGALAGAELCRVSGFVSERLLTNDTDTRGSWMFTHCTPQSLRDDSMVPTMGAN